MPLIYKSTDESRFMPLIFKHTDESRFIDKVWQKVSSEITGKLFNNQVDIISKHMKNANIMHSSDEHCQFVYHGFKPEAMLAAIEVLEETR